MAHPTKFWVGHGPPSSAHMVAIATPLLLENLDSIFEFAHPKTLSYMQKLFGYHVQKWSYAYLNVSHYFTIADIGDFRDFAKNSQNC